jgi:hypothetical protein
MTTIPVALLSRRRLRISRPNGQPGQTTFHLLTVSAVAACPARCAGDKSRMNEIRPLAGVLKRVTVVRAGCADSGHRADRSLRCRCSAHGKGTALVQGGVWTFDLAPIRRVQSPNHAPA